MAVTFTKIAKRLVRTIIKPQPRHHNPYATHLPVLVGISLSYKVGSILELGCGLYSTKAFLDSSIFPSVTKVHSLENDAEWFSQMTALQPDTRLKMSLVKGAMCDAVAEMDLTGYDLIFIDDSLTVEERARTIRAVAARATAVNVVAVHDFEAAEYRDAARDFPHNFAFDALNPHTGLAWRDERLEYKTLRSLNGLLKKYAPRIEPDDIQAWHKVINDNLRRN